MSSEKEICGVIMPISAIDGCNEFHWSEVMQILKDSIESVGYEARIVSDADDVGVIHKRIIQNLYDNPIVVCDISGKNPNVMFELGMRLAFDKPTIIVKDDETSYSFDTGTIEHIEYPRDLRFSKIVEFKAKLANKIQGTMDKFKAEPGSSTFLKHFGQFKVAVLDEKEVSGQEFIIEELRSIRLEMRRQTNIYHDDSEVVNKKGDINMCLKRYSHEEQNELIDKVAACKEITAYKIKDLGRNHSHIVIDVVDGADVNEIKNHIRPASVVRAKLVNSFKG